MRRVVRSVAVALSLALGGCLFVTAGPLGAQPPGGSSPAGPVVGAPVYGGIKDAPDPNVVPVTYGANNAAAVFSTYSFTSPNSNNYPIPEWTTHENPGGTSWSTTGDPNGGLANVPGWAAKKNPGGAVAEAPGVIQIGSTWYMYFAAVPNSAANPPRGQTPHPGAYCIGVATLPASKSLLNNQFTPVEDTPSTAIPPVLCDPTHKIAYIDPSPFYDPSNGTYYLSYKTNSASGGPGTTLWSIPLVQAPQCPITDLATPPSPGLPKPRPSCGAPPSSFNGYPSSGTAATPLLSAGSGQPLANSVQPWTQGIIENPDIVLNRAGRFSTYTLYYSGGYWGNNSYSEGWASCSGPSGPCIDGGEILGTGSMLNGPGGGSWFQDLTGYGSSGSAVPGAGWLAIHSWNKSCPSSSISAPTSCYADGALRGLYFVPGTEMLKPIFEWPYYGSQDNFSDQAGASFEDTIYTTATPSASLTLAPGSTLPTGVSFVDNNNGTASLEGTSTVSPGTYSVDVTASNIAGSTTQGFTLFVYPPLVFTSPAGFGVKQGTAHSIEITTSGTPTPTLSAYNFRFYDLATGMVTFSQPKGLSFVDNHNGTATISMSSTLPLGTYELVVSATNQFTSAVDAITINVDQLPNGVALYGIGTYDGMPVLQWLSPARLQIQGCGDATKATYTVTAVNTETNKYQSVTGTLTEASKGSGLYDATIPPLYPLHGLATLSTRLVCPNGKVETESFDIFIDPGGRVIDTSSNPVPQATVTLLESQSASGPFTPVQAGSNLLSPGTSSNPETTNPFGGFGWDTLPGYYEVSASAPGCSNPQDPSNPDVVSKVFKVPPAMDDLVLTMSCVRSAPAFSSSTKDTVRAGKSFSFPVSTTGSPTASISLLPGSSLPSGVSLKEGADGTATLVGTSSVQPGIYSFDLGAINSVGASVSRFVLEVSAPPVFSSPDTYSAPSGTPFSFTLTARGSPYPGIGPTSSASLPPHVSVTSNADGTATISGSGALAPGTYPFDLWAINDQGYALEPFTLVITAPLPQISLRFRGALNYYNHGPVLFGHIDVATRDGVVTSIDGRAKIKGIDGGYAKVTAHIARFFGFYFGTITVNDQRAHFHAVSFVFTNDVALDPNGEATSCAYSFFSILKWTL